MILPFLDVGYADHYKFERLPRQIAHLIQHIFNENAISRGGVIDEHVRHSADELAVLNDRRA